VGRSICLMKLMCHNTCETFSLLFLYKFHYALCCNTGTGTIWSGMLKVRQLQGTRSHIHEGLQTVQSDLITHTHTHTHRSSMTKFCIMVPNIFSIFIAVFSLHTMRISSHTLRTKQVTPDLWDLSMKPGLCHPSGT
jgi:hypothetical protein